MTKITKKAISVLLSAFMLLTSLPIPSFAQAIEIASKGIEELVRDGYLDEVLHGKYYGKEPFQLISFGGGEQLSKFDLVYHVAGGSGPGDFNSVDYATKGETFMRDVNGTTRWHVPEKRIAYPNNELPGWYISEADRAFEVKKKITLNGKELEPGTIIGGERYSVVREYTEVKPLEYFDDIPAKYVKKHLVPFTEEQFKELALRSDGSALRAEETTLFTEAEKYINKAKTDAYVIVEPDYLDGQWRVTNSSGKRYYYYKSQFESEFVDASLELGPGYYKAKNYLENFRQLKSDVTVTIGKWDRVLEKGTYIGYFENKLVIIEEKQFKGMYATVKEAYRQNATRINKFLLKIRDKIEKKAGQKVQVASKSRHLYLSNIPKNPKLFNKYVRNKSQDMLLDIEKKSVKRLRKQASRVFAGAVFGMGLYLALTISTAPTAQAQNSPIVATRADVIKGLREIEGRVKDIDDKSSRLENMQNTVAISDPENPNSERIADHDINSGMKLYEETAVIIPSMQAEGLQATGKSINDGDPAEILEQAEDVIAEFIADEAVEGIEGNEELQIPFVNQPAYNTGWNIPNYHPSAS